MIIYLGDNAAKPLAGTPSALMERRTFELIDSWYSTFGVRALNIGQYGEITADILQASKHAVFEFLDSVGAVAVDLTPSDIPVFAGRSVATLAAAELLDRDPAVRAGCQRLTPEEITSTVDELVRLALQVSSTRREQSDAYIAEFPEGGFKEILIHDRDQADQQALEELRHAGFDVGPDVSLEPPPAAPVVEYDFESPTSPVLVDPFAHFGDN